MNQAKEFIVLRFKRASTHDLGGIEAHGKRLGEVPHVDPSRTENNNYIFGNANLRELADERVRDLQMRNIEIKRASLKKRRRKTEVEDLDAAVEAAGECTRELAEIIGWPWDGKNTRPWTEGLLSASHDWFLDDAGNEDPEKVGQFMDFASAYLKREFGDEVIYGRVDRDEKTTHVSFVVAPEHREKRTKRFMLSHHSHRLFGQVEHLMSEVGTADEGEKQSIWTRKSYELFQDRVAEFASEHGIGLRRGKMRAQEERRNKAIGAKVLKRENVSPSRGRELAAILAGAAEEKTRQAGETLKRAKGREASAEKREHAIERGMAAVEAREIDYSPPAANRKEGLRYGPNAPKKKPAREKLREAIMPAYEATLGFAKRLFGIRQRQEELEIEAAELSRRARLLEHEGAKLGHRVPQPLREIIDAIESGAETRGSYTENAFPDAWKIDKSANTSDVEKRLRKTTNAKLSEAFSATQDAYLLCDEQPELQGRFGLGVRVLKHEADMRGLDLESGKHDPANAKDPDRATLHTDNPPEPLRVRQRLRDRQLVR